MNKILERLIKKFEKKRKEHYSASYMMISYFEKVYKDPQSQMNHIDSLPDCMDRDLFRHNLWQKGFRKQ